MLLPSRHRVDSPSSAAPAPKRASVEVHRLGMTLMEIMIVIALMAALMMITAYSLGFIGRADVQGEALRLSGVIRFIYNEAATENRTLQLIIDLDKDTFTVDELDVTGGLTREQISGATLTTSMDDDKKAEERRLANRMDEEDEQFVSLQRSKQSGPLLDEEDSMLKSGVHFLGVMTSHHEELQTEGIATINFFPSGFVERAILYVGDDGAKTDGAGAGYTLMLNSLTGQTTILPGKVDIEDRFFEAEEDD